MTRNLPYLVLFLAGLAVLAWTGASHLSTHPLGAAVIVVIAAGFLAGALELRRYRQATGSLAGALADAASACTDLGGWLGRLQPAIRNAVRLRIEGERVALPAPALTPYLVGLLVLLGMLGTLLGMMVTLRGTGLALEAAADLDAIRGSLAAPVKGLGFAFGTSIAGVAASAVLGLLSALAQRERAQVVQQLDVEAATTLRVHSRAWQREQALRLQQEQGAMLPALVERLQGLAEAIERQHAAGGERLLASQAQFHARAEESQARLVASLQALSASLEKQQAAAGEQLLAAQDAFHARGEESQSRWTASLQALAESIGQQHAASGERLLAAQAEFHARSGEAQSRWAAALQESLQAGVAESARAAGAALQPVVEATLAALAREAASTQAMVGEAVQRQLDGLSSGFASATAAAADGWRAAIDGQQQVNEALAGNLQAALERFNAAFEQRSLQLLGELGERLDGNAARMAEAWEQALQRQEQAHAALVERNGEAWARATAGFGEQAGALVESVDRSHERLQQALAGQDAQRLQAWNAQLAETGAGLREAWTAAATHASERQQAICDALAATAADITAQAQAQARDTVAEIAQLLQAAAEAPRAAAEVIGELRQQLSDSMVRDTAMLEERNQLMATLQTLLDAVNHASTEQRGAIDALLSTSAELLERVGERFGEHVQAEAGKLEAAAAQVVAGAADVASLGEAFATAVQLFGQSSSELGERLQQIEAALERSAARSDEQLAYYVAQAREVVDLSLMAQRQIAADLQRIDDTRAEGAEAA
ncbi:DUF802 domain-containing protein [Pseudoxanthomonas sp. J35]|uniref:DUF802 domain-containing protein n=1 Tax=Pseudoxanthomonas sp. J35 TaxID=935852 RepID=UPI00048EEA4E|nr:DUF802 domain-containing protein [Pseudoxanthomonas sp. J35]